MNGIFYRTGKYVDLIETTEIKVPYDYAAYWTSKPYCRNIALIQIFNGTTTYQEAVQAEDLSFIEDNMDSMLRVTTLTGMNCAINPKFIVSAEMRVAAFRKFYNESKYAPEGEYTGIWLLPLGCNTAVFDE